MSPELHVRQLRNHLRYCGSDFVNASLSSVDTCGPSELLGEDACRTHAAISANLQWFETCPNMTLWRLTEAAQGGCAYSPPVGSKLLLHLQKPL